MGIDKKTERIKRALEHLLAARSQFLDSDDEIVREHVETAILILEGEK
jgi:hypothetical protein